MTSSAYITLIKLPSHKRDLLFTVHFLNRLQAYHPSFFSLSCYFHPKNILHSYLLSLCCYSLFLIFSCWKPPFSICSLLVRTLKSVFRDLQTQPPSVECNLYSFSTCLHISSQLSILCNSRIKCEILHHLDLYKLCLVFNVHVLLVLQTLFFTTLCRTTFSDSYSIGIL